MPFTDLHFAAEFFFAFMFIHTHTSSITHSFHKWLQAHTRIRARWRTCAKCVWTIPIGYEMDYSKNNAIEIQVLQTRYIQVVSGRERERESNRSQWYYFNAFHICMFVQLLLELMIEINQQLKWMVFEEIFKRYQFSTISTTTGIMRWVDLLEEWTKNCMNWDELGVIGNSNVMWNAAMNAAYGVC